MTIEEIELLIEGYGDTCMEWQAWIDDQFEENNDGELKANMNHAFYKLLEAIKQLEAKSFARGYETREANKPIAKDAEGNIYELKEQK